MGIVEIPGSLGEAIGEIEGSELVKEILGSHVYDNWLKIKRDEWDEYRVQVHRWELEKYYQWL